MSGILNHQAATRVVFSDGREGVLLLTSLREYANLIQFSEGVFAKKGGPDYMLWCLREPIVLDPPTLLLGDLKTRGCSEQLYDADLSALADHKLHWPKPVMLYVGRWDGIIVRGVLEGVEFISDPLKIQGGLRIAS